MRDCSRHKSVLQTVVAHNEGGANKDLAKFADQIIALCEKWDR